MEFKHYTLDNGAPKYMLHVSDASDFSPLDSEIKPSAFEYDLTNVFACPKKLEQFFCDLAAFTQDDDFNDEFVYHPLYDFLRNTAQSYQVGSTRAFVPLQKDFNCSI